MTQLSPRDRELFEDLRGFGVLEQIRGDLFPITEIGPSTGMCFAILCSDGHRFADIFDHMRQTNPRMRTLIHPFADHGMPLFLDPQSPLNRNHRGENLLESIGQVPTFKGITRGWNCPHAPCVAATEFGLDLVQQIAIVKRGKTHALARVPRLDIACFMSITHREGVEHTYNVNGERWRQWVAQNMPTLAIA